MNRKAGPAVSILLLAAIAALAYWFFGRGPGSETVLTSESVKMLVPVAAAMSTEDWNRVAGSVKQPKPGDLGNQSLTILHLSLSPTTPPAAGNKTAQDTFRFLSSGPPKPAHLAEEIQRTVSLGPLQNRSDLVTSIHRDRITACTCDVDGDTARGVVEFSVPGLYAGKVSYVATRRDGQWAITEFELPGYGIRTVLGQDGVWKAQGPPAPEASAEGN